MEKKKEYIFLHGNTLLFDRERQSCVFSENFYSNNLLSNYDLSAVHMKLHNEDVFAIEVSEVNSFENIPHTAQWTKLRELIFNLTQSEFQLCGRAMQLIRWNRDHQYCGRCGQRTVLSEFDRSLHCEQCDIQYYPRISPCVIGLVKREEYCLLGRGHRHPEGLFSTLAGFIEPGENAEDAFAREVIEEVSVTIKNILYHSSQPWPFPGQLMIGFSADYDSGEIVVDEHEIIEASWFKYNDLPKVPPQSTISGRLIHEFVSKF